MTTQPLAPIDHSAATIQLETLGYKRDDAVYMRYIKPKTATEKQHAINADKLDFTQAESLQSQGYNAYYVVNGGGHNDESNTLGKAVFFEWDYLPVEEQLKLWERLRLPEPTIQISTGGKSIHNYWVFHEPVSSDIWQRLQQDAIYHTRADRLGDKARIFRLAGYRYFKKELQGATAAAIVSHSGKKYSYDELRDVFPAYTEADWDAYSPPKEELPELVAEAKEWLESVAAGTAESAQVIPEIVSGPALKKDEKYPSSDPKKNPFDHRNFMHLMPDYDSRGHNNGWATMKALCHGGESNDSLAVHRESGCISCKSGCKGTKAYWAIRNNALAQGWVFPPSGDPVHGKVISADEHKAKFGTSDSSPAPSLAPTAQVYHNGKQVVNTSTNTGSSHAAGKQPLMSALKLTSRLDALITANTHISQLRPAINLLAKSVGYMSVAEVWAMFDSRLAEHDLVNSRDDRSADIDDLLAATSATIDIRSVLPASLAEPICKKAEKLNIRPEVFMSAFLTTVSVLHKVGTAVYIESDDPFSIHPNIYTAIVAPSSQKKSPILRAMVSDPMRPLKASARQDLQKADVQYKANLAHFKSLKGDAQRDAFPNGEPQPPKLKLYVINDPTGEAILRQMERHPEQGILYLRDELAGIFKSANQYRGGRGSDEEDLLTYYDGEGSVVLRVEGVKADLDKVLLGILGSIQPDVLRTFLRECNDPNGKWARFIFVNQPLAATKMTPAFGGGGINLTPMLTDLYTKIDALPPTIYRLDYDALEYFCKMGTLFDNTRVDIAHPGMGNVWGKCTGRVGKLVINLHVVHELFAGVTPSETIPLARVEEAVKLTLFYVEQIRSLYLQFSDSSAIAPHLAKIIELSRRKGWIKTRDVQLSITGYKRPTSDSVRGWFQELVAMGRGQVRGEIRRIEFLASEETEKFVGAETPSQQAVEKTKKFVDAETPSQQAVEEFVGDLGEFVGDFVDAETTAQQEKTEFVGDVGDFCSSPENIKKEEFLPVDSNCIPVDSNREDAAGEDGEINILENRLHRLQTASNPGTVSNTASTKSPTNRLQTEKPPTNCDLTPSDDTALTKNSPDGKQLSTALSTPATKSRRKRVAVAPGQLSLFNLMVEPEPPTEPPDDAPPSSPPPTKPPDDEPDSDGGVSQPATPKLSPDGGAVSEPAAEVVQDCTMVQVIPTSESVDKLVDKTVNKPLAVTDSYLLVTDAAALSAVIEPLHTATVFGIDTETTGLDPHRDKLRLVQIAMPRSLTVIVDIFAFTHDELEPLRRILSNDAVKVGHNLKFEIQFLAQAGLPLAGQLFDTMLVSQTLASGIRKEHKLAKVVNEYLGEDLSKDLQASDWGKDLTVEQLEYAARDASVVLRLRDVMRLRLKESKLIDTAKLEFDALPAVAEMELNGITLDTDKWTALGQKMMSAKDETKKELDALLATHNLKLDNPNSPPQTLAVLQALNVPVKSTGKKVLKPLVTKYPIVKILLAYRKYEKAASSFTDKLLEHINPATGKIHASFWQYGCDTGRFSCSTPNLQQIPRDRAFRECFVPSPGHTLVIADYSQIELRVAAEVSRDRTMIEAYQKGEDLHKLTASLITGKPLDEITKAERQSGKPVNFGLIYGCGFKTLGQTAANDYGVEKPDAEWKTYRYKFFSNYRGIASWHSRLEAERPNEVRTLVGRRRQWAETPWVTATSNSIVQGTAADITKKALAMLPTALKSTGAKLIAVIHDEILLEVSPTAASAAAQILKDTMVAAGEDFLKLVPVEVEVKIADSWADK